MAVEEPVFDLLAKGGALELRRYGATPVAQTLVHGDRDAASTRGFKVIADCIFGNSHAAGSAPQAHGSQPSEKIETTTPVVAKPVQQLQKIAMTAPVTAEPAGVLLQRHR